MGATLRGLAVPANLLAARSKLGQHPPWAPRKYNKTASPFRGPASRGWPTYPRFWDMWESSLPGVLEKSDGDCTRNLLWVPLCLTLSDPCNSPSRAPLLHSSSTTLALLTTDNCLAHQERGALPRRSPFLRPRTSRTGTNF